MRKKHYAGKTVVTSVAVVWWLCSDARVLWMLTFIVLPADQLTGRGLYMYVSNLSIRVLTWVAFCILGTWSRIYEMVYRPPQSSLQRTLTLHRSHTSHHHPATSNTILKIQRAISFKNHPLFCKFILVDNLECSRQVGRECPDYLSHTRIVPLVIKLSCNLQRPQSIIGFQITV